MRFYGGKDGSVPVIGVRDPGQCKPNLQGSVAVQSAIGGFDAPGSTPLPFGQSGSSSSSATRPKSAKERRQWRQYLHNRSAGAADVIGVAKGAASRAQVPDGVDASSANGAGIESSEASARHSRRMKEGASRPGGKRQVQLQQSKAVWSILAEDAPPASRIPATASGSGSQGTRAPEEPRVKRGKGRRYAALLEGAQAASVTGIGPQIPEGKGPGNRGPGNKPQEGPHADGAYLKGQPAKAGATA